MLPKTKRLTKKRDFSKLGTQGRSAYGAHMTMRVRQIKAGNGTTVIEPRVAFITSTKVMKKAVDRNRAKRRMREVVRSVWKDIPNNVHVLFILQPAVKDLPYAELVAEVKHLLAKIPSTLLKPARPSPRARKVAEKRKA